MSAVTFDCDLGHFNYPIHVGNVVKEIDHYVTQVFSGNKIIIVIDEYIDNKYGQSIYPHLQGKYQISKHIVRGGKESKTMSSVLKIFNSLDNENFSRDSLMIGIGGGVIGDMAGFAASCWYRGMKLMHIPTTLLSAVDSCVGGKTAINLGDTVNAIGSYYHPVSILIDTGIIGELPAREVSSGMGEVIKYAAMYSKTISDTLDKKSYTEVVSELSWIITESLKTKALFVHGDINEDNKRLYLNFGHTLGHAIEFATILDGDETLRHGEAVGLGMISIFRISEHLGYIKEDQILWLKNILRKFNLPITYSASSLNMSKASLLHECMSLVVKDKKRKFNTLRLVILTSIRVPTIYETNDMDLIKIGFEEVISE